MGHFTTEEANNSMIVRAEAILKNDVHQYWVFGVNDTDGNFCDWKDKDLSGSATDSEQKATIFTHLTTMCQKLGVKPTISGSTNNDIVDTTVGS